MTGFCEHGNEPSGCIKYGEFLDWLQNDEIFKMDSAPWSKLTFRRLMSTIVDVTHR